MRRNELTIVLALVVIGMIAAFWLIGLSPKREQAASLKQDIDGLQLRLDEAQQAAAVGEQERKSFPRDYRRLVVLGKAVPEDGDQAGLLVQLQRLADRAGVRFQALDLSASNSSAATAEPVPPATTDSTSAASTETTNADSSTGAAPSAASTDTAATATEASAATLPIGASVGPAGLPVMPYQLKFTGGFFEIADFLESLDRLVHARHAAIDVHGRLLTVDGFALKPSDSASQTGAVSPIPTLTADLSVTTYLTPGDQGLTAGASPGEPLAATPESTPAPAASSTPNISPSQ